MPLMPGSSSRPGSSALPSSSIDCATASTRALTAVTRAWYCLPVSTTLSWNAVPAWTRPSWRDGRFSRRRGGPSPTRSISGAPALTVSKGRTYTLAMRPENGAATVQ